MENEVQESGWDTLKGTLFVVAALLVVAFFVPVLFSIVDRKLAGLVAGALFLSTSILVIHAAQMGQKHLPMMVTGSLFLFGFSVPILVLRLAFWGEEFNSIQIGGVTGRQIHTASTYFYIAMLGASLHRAYLKYKNK